MIYWLLVKLNDVHFTGFPLFACWHVNRICLKAVAMGNLFLLMDYYHMCVYRFISCVHMMYWIRNHNVF